MQIGVGAMWLNHSATSKNSGLSRYASNLVDGLAASGQDTLKLVCPQEFEVPLRWKSSGFVQTSKAPSEPLWRRALWEYFEAGRWARGERLDVWLSLAPALPRSPGCPRVAMIHDVIPLVYPQGHRRATVVYAKWSIGFACRHADRVLANSYATKSELVRLFGIAPDRVTVTHLGPGNQVDPIEPALALQKVPFKRYLIALGNLEPRKNLDRLIHAHEQIRMSEPDLGLVLVGAPRNEHVPGAVRDGVCWYGYAADEDLPHLFAKAEAFVFPSLYEGFGLPVLEAMKLGAPVVASDIPAVVEVGHRAVKTFDPRNIESIVSSVSDVLADPLVRRQMRCDGFERARDFSWRKTVEQTRAALQSVVQT